MAWKYLRGRTWWIGCKVKGTPRPIRFSAETTSKRAAERIRSKVEVEIAEGQFLERHESSSWTLAELGAVYLPRMAALKPRSDRWRRDRWTRIEAAIGAATPLESITLGTLDAAATAWLQSGKSVSTARGNVSVLRHAIGQAVRWKADTGLTQYRLAGWTLPKGREARRPVALSRDDVGRLLYVAKARARMNPAHRRAEVLLRLALETGARVTELCEITRADFDGERGWLWIRALKGGDDRFKDVGPELARDLRGLFRRAERPFAGGGAAKDRFRRFWRGVRKDAGLLALRFHDLRHTYAADYMRRGGAERDLQHELGHRTSRMTQRYSHFSPKRKPAKAPGWKVKAWRPRVTTNAQRPSQDA